MLLLSEPSDEYIKRVIAACHDAPLSYAPAGVTRDFGLHKAARGFVLDHNRVLLGFGRNTYLRAARALSRWQMFETSLTRIVPRDAEIKRETIVAVIGHHFRVHSLNLCRIVYTIDAHDEAFERYGFAYGTLENLHLESGEERFMIERNRATDEVYYDLLAVSRPQNLLIFLGYPLARTMQQRFARESKRAMRQATA